MTELCPTTHLPCLTLECISDVENIFEINGRGRRRLSRALIDGMIEKEVAEFVTEGQKDCSVVEGCGVQALGAALAIQAAAVLNVRAKVAEL
jgi:hypothetical protein